MKQINELKHCTSTNRTTDRLDFTNSLLNPLLNSIVLHTELNSTSEVPTAGLTSKEFEEVIIIELHNFSWTFFQYNAKTICETVMWFLELCYRVMEKNHFQCNFSVVLPKLLISNYYHEVLLLIIIAISQFPSCLSHSNIQDHPHENRYNLISVDSILFIFYPILFFFYSDSQIFKEKVKFGASLTHPVIENNTFRNMPTEMVEAGKYNEDMHDAV